MNFGAKKHALAREESRAVYGPCGNGASATKLWVKDDDFAGTRTAGGDLWGDERVESGVFVSPRLVQTLHKDGNARDFHLLRCRIE